ncbi:MAG: potassium channel family protein, partial [Candidatus Micrarchaeota archaeon]|nr:potassium channel family protein [Candidatus Micrarchaeota archaeon]
MDSLQEKIVQAAGITLVIVVIGAVFYNFVEGWNWIDSTYFAVSTLTTVGFGDLHPTHSISRLFMIFYMLFGIPVMFYTITLLGVYSVEKRGYTHSFKKIFGKTP